MPEHLLLRSLYLLANLIRVGKWLKISLCHRGMVRDDAGL